MGGGGGGWWSVLLPKVCLGGPCCSSLPKVYLGGPCRLSLPKVCLGGGWVHVAHFNRRCVGRGDSVLPPKVCLGDPCCYLRCVWGGGVRVVT